MHYSCLETETIEITDKFVGYLRNWSGVVYGGHTSLDSHFVAFSTNKPIEKLIDADVYYVSQSVEVYGLGNENKHSILTQDYGEKKSKIVTLSNVDTVTINGTLFTKTYTWNRIQSVKAFSTSNNLKDEDKKAIANKEWVFLFAETNYTFTSDASYSVRKKYTEVSEVSILRLKFETNGKVYNLGVVDGKQTGSKQPSNTSDTFNFLRYVWNCIVKLFTGKASFVEGIVAVVVLFVVFLALPIVLLVLSIVFPTFRAVMKSIFKAIGKGLLWFLKAIGKALLWLLKGLWWLVCLPFRGIAALFKKRKGGARRGGSKRSRKRARA